MRFSIVFAVTFLLLLEVISLQSSMAQQKSADVNHEEALKEARRLADELGDKLRGLLFQELQKGGPATAVRICSEVAQEMTREFNRRQGYHARRVSVRYRNPQNLPDEYERQVLMRMELENQQKHLAKEYIEVVKEENVKLLRYMRPLIVAPVCMNCHGPKETMTPGVKQLLTERYPEDRATGFHDGDLRGAISIKIELKPEQSR
jgi:hypothetical protein